MAEVLLKFYVKWRHSLSKISNFCNFSQFPKIYVTTFVPRQFWWRADCGFNGIKIYLYQNFCPVRHSCWLYYTVLWLIRSKLYFFGIRIQKSVLLSLYRLRTNYIRLNNLQSIKILTKDTMDNLSINEDFLTIYSLLFIH